MINLWYEDSYWAHRQGIVSGPEKVVKNFIKSLDLEGIPYSINQERYDTNFLMQYNADGHRKHECLEHESCYIGPQFWGWDAYGKFLFDNPDYYNKLITPSEWVSNQLITQFNVPSNKVVSWPVGIDITNVTREIEYDFLIYFKRRSDKELNLVKKFLDEKGMTYIVFGYGNYSQNDFINTLSKVRFAFLLNGTESQGIAVQEIMASDTPCLVWDVKEWNDMGEEWATPATSIPYWSEECGEFFYKYSELGDTFSKFIGKNYNPQMFVKRELSLKASLNKFMEIIV
tara:strand:+ start:6398 stop:7255 length:858 start_codon:yes stop_codon:yes gene_type:complete